MASLRTLDRIIRLFMQFYPGERFITTPYTPMSMPLNVCKVALITTAGYYLTGQEPYGKNDCTFREIPNSIQSQELIIGHRSDAYDETGMETDPNLVFPLDRFRELERDNKIGELNHRHFSFMGSITKPKQLISQTAPKVAQMLRSDGVNVVFLTPV